MPEYEDLLRAPIAVFDWNPLVAASHLAYMTDARIGHVWNSDQRAVMSEGCKRLLTCLRGTARIDIVVDGDGRLGKLDCGYMHDVTDEDDLLSLALHCIKGAPWSMAGVNGGSDAGHDLRCTLKTLDLARIDIELDCLESLIEVLHVIVRFR